MLHRFFTFFLSAAFLLAFSACDSSDPDDGGDLDPGAFSVQVQGDVSSSFDGTAFFGEATDPETGETGFVIALGEGDGFQTGTPDQGANYALLVRFGSRPGTGTYPFFNVEEDDGSDDIPADVFAGLVFLASESGVPTVFFSEGGSVTITSSSNDRVAGRFEMTATGFTFSGNQAEEVTVTIEASFNADRGDTYFLPGEF